MPDLGIILDVFGVPFGGHFGAKTASKNEIGNRCAKKSPKVGPGIVQGSAGDRSRIGDRGSNPKKPKDRGSDGLSIFYGTFIYFCISSYLMILLFMSHDDQCCCVIFSAS